MATQGGIALGRGRGCACFAGQEVPVGRSRTTCVVMTDGSRGQEMARELREIQDSPPEDEDDPANSIGKPFCPFLSFRMLVYFI